MAFSIVVRQIVILAILVLAGVAASKAKVITSAARDLLAKIIFNITLPAMLFTNFSKIELTPKLLSNSLQVIILAACVLLFMLLVGWVTTRIFGIKGIHSAIFRLHSMLGNIIYLGLPVIVSLFGQEGLLYGSMFVLVSNILMWTVGVAIVTSDGAFSARERLKKIFNLNTISIVTGFILFLFSVKIPPILVESVGGLGSTTPYLSMIYIGTVLFYADARAVLRNRDSYLMSFNKMLLVPVLLLLLFRLVNYLFPLAIDSTVINVLVLQSAMPCMVNVVIMVNVLGRDDGQATANVFATTILSLVTLPLMLLILNFFG